MDVFQAVMIVVLIGWGTTDRDNSYDLDHILFADMGSCRAAAKMMVDSEYQSGDPLMRRGTTGSYGKLIAKCYPRPVP